MTAIISLSDLNTAVNHEPRVIDALIAEKLGYERPRVVRELIERNRSEIETYGSIAVRRGETSVKGGRPPIEYYLNEGQSLVICALSRTAKAAEVRKAIIEVFMAFRNGNLQPSTPDTPLTPAQQHALQQAIRARKELSGGIYAYWWSRFNAHFQLGSYKQLPPSRFAEALSYIETMPEPEGAIKALPAPERPDIAALQREVERLHASIQVVHVWLRTVPGYPPAIMEALEAMMNMSNSAINNMQAAIFCAKHASERLSA